MSNKKSNSKIMSVIEKAMAKESAEIQSKDAEALYEENVRLKALILRYGLSLENEKFTDVELLCVKQIDQFKKIFEFEVMEKKDAEAFEKLHNILTKEQLKDKVKPKQLEKDYSNDELNEMIKNRK